MELYWTKYAGTSGLAMLATWPVVFMAALKTPACAPPMSIAAAQLAASASMEDAAATAISIAAIRGCTAIAARPVQTAAKK